MSSDTVKFEASFKKVDGAVSVTPTHIAWNPSAAGAMDRQHQALSRVTNMLASKAGSARTSLKLVFKDDVPKGGLLFTFTGPAKDADRQAVQDLLIPFVSAHRTGGAATPAPNPAIAAVASASTPASTPGSPAPGTPGTPASVARKRKAEEMTPADAEARRRTNKVRERVLRSNPTLQELHRQLVLGRQITEDEFWDGKQRQALLKSEELAYAQRPGRPSRLLDDRFDLSGNKDEKFRGGTGVGLKKVESGPTVLNITKELTREIFEEFPVVQDAYSNNVPRISEGEFWKRYFTSTLWERHRASVRKTALDDGARRKDDIFDVYLEDPDWNTAPRKKMPDSIEKFLDLAATEEDHGDASIIRDVTMQAGKERSSLPLIRRFNQHSEKLLRAGRQDGAAGAASSSDLLEQIDMMDLHAPAAPDVIPLQVAGAVSADKGGPRGILPGRADAELLAMADAEAARLAAWDADFATVCLPNPDPANGGPGPGSREYDAYAYQRDAQFVAQRVVRDMHNAANAEDAVYPELPKKIVDDMRMCHNAASEFLRQYWAAVLPPAAGTLATNQTPGVRAARAAKMAGFLEKTESRVEAIVMMAQMEKIDPARVRASLAPTLGAVAVALRREKARAGKV